MGIVVFGSVFLDIKGYPLTKYIPGGRNAGRVEQVHGGVSRNVAEDLANLELRPTFVSLVDDNGSGDDVIRRLNNHKVNTDYILRCEDGMGTWLAVFDSRGDVVASISKRPDLTPIEGLLREKGDEIISAADSVVLEMDMEKDTVKLIYALAQKYHKAVYAVVSNMSIAFERRDLLKQTDCFVCNQQEAGILFSEDLSMLSPKLLAKHLYERVRHAQIPRMVVTMGSQGAVYASCTEGFGVIAPIKVDVIDTTGAGDAFFSGVTAGLTYGRTLEESCRIGTRLASAVICTKDSVCPRFLPQEFGLAYPPEA